MTTKAEYNPDAIRGLENYLQTCNNPKTVFMEVGGRKYNLPDIIKEIKARTEQGMHFYKAWEELYKASLIPVSGSSRKPIKLRDDKEIRELEIGAWISTVNVANTPTNSRNGIRVC